MRPLAIVLLLLAAFAAACGSDDAGAPGASTYEAATERGAFAVGVTTLELVDTSRPTDANGDFTGADERTFTVEVWYPAVAPEDAAETRDAALDAGGAPYPLVVFAHGFSSHRRQSASYTQHLASHGYVVFAPDFPLSNGNAPGGPRFADLPKQPGDVSFIVDQALAMSEEEGHLLEGAADGDAIGVTGHSMGAFTTVLALYGADRDERIDAALPVSGSGCFLTEEQTADVSVPVMFLTGSEDLIVAPSGNRMGYELARPPRYWVEITGGNHIRFAEVDAEDTLAVEALRRIGGDRAPEGGRAVAEALGTDLSACALEAEPSGAETLGLERQQELLRAFATPFFDAYLRGSEAARAFLEEELPALADVSFEYER